jgi:hypothetical protein
MVAYATSVGSATMRTGERSRQVSVRSEASLEEASE